MREGRCEHAMIRVAIVEDTKPDQDRLIALIDEWKASHDSIIVTDAYPDAVAFLEQGAETSDIVFMDIRMPYMSGMEAARKLGLPVSFHEEDPRLIAQNGIHRGEVSRKLGLSGSPHEAEDVLVERDCRLALETGCKVVIQHISSARSVELVRRAKEAGASVFAEATPHHFSLTQEAVLQYGSLAKMNPPLRTEEDRQALIRGLQDGTIDVIATDHAPHSREEKERPFTEAPSGIIGLETALALGITNLVRPGYLSLEELMRKMSVNPARLYGLETPGICPGAPADLVLFAEEEAWQVESFYSRASNSPFTGSTLYGRVHATICGGRIVYKLKEF